MKPNPKPDHSRCQRTLDAPVAARPIPKTQLEFEQAFATEEACYEFIRTLKWRWGYECPKCGRRKSRRKSRDRIVCVRCLHETTLLTGTLFSQSKLPLRTWLHALWWMTGQKNGISAKGFQRLLGLGSYKTAWTWLHKLRAVMAATGQDQLDQPVEVDETYVGGVRTGPQAAGGRFGKVLIAVAAELVTVPLGKKTVPAIGRIRLAIIPNRRGKTLEAFVCSAVKPGTTVYTDGLRSYGKLADMGYPHCVKPNPKRVRGQSRPLPSLRKAHLVISLLKRWLLGTHQGRVETKHLESYLNEFVFRFNRKRAGNRGVLFKTLVGLCVNWGELSRQKAAMNAPSPAGTAGGDAAVVKLTAEQ